MTGAEGVYVGQEQTIFGRIRDLKGKPFGDIVEPDQLAPIDNAHAPIPFTLKLLTAECAHNAQIMQDLGRWRKANEFWFQAIFPITAEGTVRWFETQVTAQRDRLLFLVDVAGQSVGHVGLFRFECETDACEIDNIVRGEREHPGAMSAACQTLMRWGRRELGIRHYKLQTYSDNVRALAMYRRMGFVETSRTPMKRVVSGTRVDWLPLEPGERLEPVMRNNIHMELSRET